MDDRSPTLTAPQQGMICPSLAQWRAYALGTVGEEAIEWYSAHLESCPACEALMPQVETEADTALQMLRESTAITPYQIGQSVAEIERLLAQVLAQEPFAESATSAPDAATTAVGVGSQLGPYRLLEKLGEGGMATVYQARHEHTGRLVALKLVKHQRLTDPQHVARFRREMLAAGSMEHRQVVQSLDAGEIGGQPYLAMEYVRGETFGELVARQGRVPVPEACRLIGQVAEVLAVLHARGVVHRDIKPSNLMRCLREQDSAETEVKILDLGLVRLLEPLATETSTAGTVVGTADYMSPEQSLDSRTADARSDIYSLGCTLYCLLHGRPPFAEASYATFTQKALAHVHVLPQRLDELHRDVPPALARIVAHMLAKEPDQRYQSAAEVAEALRPYHQHTDGTFDEARFAPQRRRTPIARWTALIALALVTMVVLGIWLGRERHSPESEPEPKEIARIDHADLPPTILPAPAPEPEPPAPAPPQPASLIPPEIAAVSSKVVAWPVAEGGNGHFYVLSDQQALWTDAQSIAAGMAPAGYRSYLLSVTSPEENIMVANDVFEQLPVWIGLTDSEEHGGQESRERANPKIDGWHWLSGEPVAYTAWGPGRPQHVPEQDFVFMYVGGAWDDGNNFALHFLVELEPLADPPPPLE